jgi:hypothetical protein
MELRLYLGLCDTYLCLLYIFKLCLGCEIIIYKYFINSVFPNYQNKPRKYRNDVDAIGGGVSLMRTGAE